MIIDRRAAGALLAALAGTWCMPSQAATVGVADYARAESFLPSRVKSEVLHTVESPTWLGNETLWYRTYTAQGGEFVRERRIGRRQRRQGARRQARGLHPRQRPVAA